MKVSSYPRTLLFYLYLMFLGQFVNAQSNVVPKQLNPYDLFVRQADSLYKIKEYKRSAEAYSKAFQTIGGKGRLDHRISAAKSWTLAGKPDSAYFNLERVVATGYYNVYDQLANEPDFVSLHQDTRWKNLLKKIEMQKEQSEAKLNRPLAAILDSIYQSDQGPRLMLDSTRSKFGENSPQMQQLLKEMNANDYFNLVKVKSILDKYGWLGTDEVGQAGNTTLFLVIQHAELEDQLHYLPMMRQAVKQGKASGSQLALLEDRVNIRQLRPQIYGSQIGQNPDNGAFYVLPLADPDHVDERRKEVGLPPLAVYLINWNTAWDVQLYKKQLPEIMRLNGM